MVPALTKTSVLVLPLGLFDRSRSRTVGPLVLIDLIVVSLPVRGFGGRQADRGRRDLHEAAEVHHRGAEGAAAPRPQAGGLPLGHRAAQGVQAAGVAGMTECTTPSRVVTNDILRWC